MAIAGLKLEHALGLRNLAITVPVSAKRGLFEFICDDTLRTFFLV